MRYLNKFKKLTVGISALVLTASVFGIINVATNASASSQCYQYNPNGFPTSSTPVFNHICGAPENVGDEANFVRIRQNSNGNDEDNINNSTYNVGNLSNACIDGSKFDVWNYVHNDADQNDNNNGAGSAVAHNVRIAITAPLGKTATQFIFKTSISASNASTVTDSAILDCQGQIVKMSLVPSTVHIYSIPYASWENLPDSSINGTTTLGSPTFGSGDQWGCWEYRMVIVYQVVVQKVTTPPPVTPPASTGVCKVLSLTATGKSGEVSAGVTGQVANAKIIGYRIDFGDGTVVGQQSATHVYSASGTYSVTGYVEVQLADGSINWVSANSCQGKVEVAPIPPTPPVTPPTTPPTTVIVAPPTPPTTTPPTRLVNTGPGSVVGLFLATSVIGAIAYRLFLKRRYNQ